LRVGEEDLLSPREKITAPIRRSKKLEQEPPAPRRERRALSHVGGEVSIEGGSTEEGEALSYALDVSAHEEDVMQDVHGFHSYPARLHPQTARRLVERLSPREGRVLDPFCGSGTVVVEARTLGRSALGSDVNPLAVELSWLKSRGFTRKFSENMVRAAERIAQKAEDRRTEKAPPFVRYDDDDRERYPIHILLELDSLTHGVMELELTEQKRALRLVLSSLLTKVSYSEGDTTRMKAPRRLPPGFAIRLFVEKTRELEMRLNLYLKRVPERTPRAHVTHADARSLAYVERASIDLVVSSPPYPGVYDYLDHHLHRLRWLGLRESRLSESEIGARREYKRLDLEGAIQRWRREIGPCLKEMRRTLTSDGRGIMIIADSVADRRALRADEQIRIAAEEYGVDIMAIASQERPLFLHGAEEAFRDGPRLEHVVIFRPAKAKKTISVASANAESNARAPYERGATRGRREDTRGPQADRSQPNTWGSRPKAPEKPRSKF
jgi:DNA modification methylase